MEKDSIVSTYRNNYTVDTLRRIHNVTGQETPISGDAPLRMQHRLLKAKMQEIAREIEHRNITAMPTHPFVW